MPENRNSQLSHSYRKIKRALSFRRRVFGQSLEDTLWYERRFGERTAPLVVERCVAFVRQRGLQEVGLFRQPGQATLVRELQQAFDSGERPSFHSSTDVHTVASLLKLYLRELPEPVIPFSHYQSFLTCGTAAPGGREQDLEDLKKLLRQLPTANFNLLHYICRFLNEVQSYSHINKMSTQNLATVFGPNIVRPRAQDPEAIIGGVCVVQQLMSVLIRESGRLFLTDASSAPTLPTRQGQRADPPAVAAETLPGPPPPPPAPMMDHRPPPRQSASPRRASDPLYDNCPSRSPERSSATPPALPDPTAPAPTLLDSWDVPWGAEPGGSAGGASLSSRSSSPGELIGRNAHESTLSVYDNLDVPPAGPGAAPAPPRPPLEDSGDSSSWSSCEIVLEEAKPGAGPAFGPFPFRAEAGDPPPDFPSVQALLALAGPDLDPSASPSSVRYLVAGLKQQISRQKEEYEAQIRSLEKRNEALQGEVSGLRANLEQHRRWYKVAEIKMRNAERARADADRRNTALQQEMEQFFDTFGELNVEAKKTERIVQGF